MRQYSPEELRRKYDDFAPHYDSATAILDFLVGIQRLRRKLISAAQGEVLEIAAGTGRNLPFYPRSCQITAVDLSPAMLEIARRRADRLGLNVTFKVMDAEALDFPDRSFDTITSSLSLCTFPNPVAALREMSRVCRVDGRLLLLEHGRSRWEWLGRWMDRTAGRHAEAVGCHWNRQPLELVRQAGLTLIDSQQVWAGIFHTLEAVPGH